jgi:ligand-binding sensor protein
MDLKMDDIIDVSKHQKLLDNFCESVGIAAAIIDLDGNIIIGSRWQKICTDFFRANELSCQRCVESDTSLANRLMEGERYSLYRCRNGLTDAASPIVVQGTHIANAFVGQFLLEPPDTSFFSELADQFNFEKDAFLQALAEVPIIEERRIPVVVNFMVSYAELLAGIGIEPQEADRI